MTRPDLGPWWVRAGLAVVLTMAIAVVLGAVNRPTWEPRQIVAVDGDRSSAELTVTIAHDRCGNEPRLRLTVMQSDDLVQLRVEQDATGDCDAIGLESTRVVQLTDPLGRRGLVVDDVPGDPRSVECITADHGSVRCR